MTLDPSAILKCRFSFPSARMYLYAPFACIHKPVGVEIGGYLSFRTDYRESLRGTTTVIVLVVNKICLEIMVDGSTKLHVGIMCS